MIVTITMLRQTKAIGALMAGLVVYAKNGFISMYRQQKTCVHILTFISIFKRAFLFITAREQQHCHF